MIRVVDQLNDLRAKAARRCEIGWKWGQGGMDPIEYGIRTHHTYVDTYDHLVIDDLKQAAVVVASTLYHLAMRDEMMPRQEMGTN